MRSVFAILRKQVITYRVLYFVISPDVKVDDMVNDETRVNGPPCGKKSYRYLKITFCVTDCAPIVF